MQNNRSVIIALNNVIMISNFLNVFSEESILGYYFDIEISD